MADIGEARLRLTATDESGGAFASMKANVQSINKQFETLSNTLGNFGVALSAGAIVQFLRNTLDLTAKLDDMAESTGASVEELSRLSQIARIGGHDLGTVENMVLRLTKAVSDGGKTQVAAFKAIGLEIEELRAMRQDELIETLALRMAEFEDGVGKSNVGLAIWNKTWKESAPLLKDIAEMQHIQANRTAEQAAQAERLQKSWAAFKNEMQDIAEALAIPLFQGWHVILMGISHTLQNIIDGLGTFQEMLKAIGRLDIQGALTYRDQYRGRVAGRETEFKRTIDELLNPTGPVVQPRGRNLAFAAPDPEAEAAKKAEMKRLSDYVLQLEREEHETQKRNMREDEAEIKRILKEQEDAQAKINKGWVDVIDQQIEAEKQWGEAAHRRAQEELKVQEKSAEDARRAWERQFDIVSESLTDALMRGFEGGKDWADNFVDTLKNMFSTLVLRPVIQAIVSPVAGAITGALGFGGSAFASGLMPGESGGIPGGGGFGNMIGIGTSIAGLIGGSSATMGAAVGNMAISMFGPGAASIGFAIGSALPYVGLALGAASLLGLGKKKSPAVGIGVRGQGTVGWGGDLGGIGWTGMSQNATQQFAWPTFDHFAALGVEQDAQKMVDDLFGKWTRAFEEAGLSTEILKSKRLPVDFLIPGQSPGELSGEKALKAFEEALAGASQTLNEEFGPALSLIAGLTGYKKSLAMSGFEAPLTRFTTARDLLERQFEAAMTGDTTAIQNFPALASQALDLGRQLYASGPQFADLYRAVQKMIDALIAEQREKVEKKADETAEEDAKADARTEKVVQEVRSLNATVRRLFGAVGA